MDEQASLSTNKVRRRNEDSEETPLRLFIHGETMPPAPSAYDSATNNVIDANPSHTIGATSDVVNVNPSHTMINVKLPNLKEVLTPSPSACNSNAACDQTAPQAKSMKLTRMASNWLINWKNLQSVINRNLGPY